MGGGLDEDDFALSGGSDLQIDLGDVAPSKPGVAESDAFGAFDDDYSSGPSLELDTVGGSLPPRISSPSVTNPPSGPSLPAAPISHRALPPGPGPRSPQPTAPEPHAVDAFEAKALADYGPPPSAFWAAPLYAYRVVSRRGALRRDLEAKRADAERMRKRLDDALVALGDRARALAKGGAPALERVRQAEELLRSRDGALAGAMDAHRSALVEIDARLVAAEAELARARDEEARAAATRDDADAEHKRADAKVKRIDIEIRNGASARAAERDAAAAEAAQKDARRAEAEGKLQDARRVALAAQAKVDAAQRERSEHDARFSRQSGTRNAGVDDAHGHLRAALAELGRAMLADPSLAAELGAARDEVARLEASSHKHADDVALHDTALRAYDAPQVFLGIALVALAFLILLGVVFFPLDLPLVRELTQRRDVGGRFEVAGGRDFGGSGGFSDVRVRGVPPSAYPPTRSSRSAILGSRVEPIWRRRITARFWRSLYFACDASPLLVLRLGLAVDDLELADDEDDRRELPRVRRRALEQLGRDAHRHVDHEVHDAVRVRREAVVVRRELVVLAGSACRGGASRGAASSCSSS